MTIKSLIDDRLAVEAEHDRLEALADDWRDRDSAWELANDEPEYSSQGPMSDLDWSRYDEARPVVAIGIGWTDGCADDSDLEDDDIPF